MEPCEASSHAIPSAATESRNLVVDAGHVAKEYPSARGVHLSFLRRGGFGVYAFLTDRVLVGEPVGAWAAQTPEQLQHEVIKLRCYRVADQALSV